MIGQSFKCSRVDQITSVDTTAHLMTIRDLEEKLSNHHRRDRVPVWAESLIRRANPEFMVVTCRNITSEDAEFLSRQTRPFDIEFGGLPNSELTPQDLQHAISSNPYVIWVKPEKFIIESSWDVDNLQIPSILKLILENQTCPALFLDKLLVEF